MNNYKRRNKNYHDRLRNCSQSPHKNNSHTHAKKLKTTEVIYQNLKDKLFKHNLQIKQFQTLQVLHAQVKIMKIKIFRKTIQNCPHKQ